ncbi:hypothetical protein B7463_g2661, partial [Scytalidium lignicola]
MIASTSWPPPGMNTPDSITAANSVFGDTPADTEAVPWPGRTFIIVDDRNRALTLVDGNLKVEDIHTESHGSGCRWKCVETNGWLGFYNTTSGSYIGHNGHGNRKIFQASVRHHKTWETFCPRRHPDGGYILLVAHHVENLWKVRIDEGNKGLFATADGEGTRWRFIRV